MASSFRGAWRHRGWRWLLASFAVSSVGDYLYFVAIVVFLAESTHSASWLAAAAVARLLAYALFGSLGGVIADRFDRRRLMVLLDFVRAGIMAVLAVVVASDGHPALLVGLTVLNAIASTPYRPALVAATPALVQEDDLAAANAAESIVGQVAFFVGPAIGGIIAATAGAATAFVVNAISFAISGLLLARLPPVGGGGKAAPSEERRTVRSDVHDGLQTVRSTQGLGALVAFSCAIVFLYGFEQVVHVLVVTERLGMSASGVGLLSGAIGVGGIIVAPFSARLGDGQSAGMLLGLTGVVVGLPLALLAVVSSPALAVVLLLVEGAGCIVYEVLFITLLQRATPEDMLARVFGLQDSVASVGQLLGSLVVPLLIAGVHLEATLWIGGLAVVGAGVVLARPLDRLARRTESERRRVAPVAQRLGSLGLLGDAPRAALDRMARAARPLSFSAGTDVFVEGDAPDDLFVIVSGHASVHRAGVGELSRLGVDEWFGEVGLIRQLPRNATVTARDDLEVLAIPGHVFLDALATNEVLPDPLRVSLAARVVTTPPPRQTAVPS